MQIILVHNSVFKIIIIIIIVFHCPLDVVFQLDGQSVPEGGCHPQMIENCTLCYSRVSVMV